jgi:hypothetical protein
VWASFSYLISCYKNTKFDKIKRGKSSNFKTPLISKMKNLNWNLVPKRMPIQFELGDSQDYLDLSLPGNTIDGFLLGFAAGLITATILYYRFG